MGLDMYLCATPKGKKMADYNYDLETDESTFDLLEIGYWRKANQIFHWFENQVADGQLKNCEYYIVSQKDLEDLKNVCQEVLHHREDVSFARKYLPTQEGFCFGPLNYDDYYFGDLKRTIEICNEASTIIDWDSQEVAFYAWW